MQKTLSLVLFLFFAATVAPCQSGQKQDGTPQPYVAQKPSRLARAFHTDSAWSGGDGAYSISLGKDRTLWIFGDSFIGTISGGRRLNNVMIHNAIALQDQKSGKMSFYWAKQSQPASYFADKDSYWLWPGDGIFYNDRVYCFARQVAQVQGKENDPFGFVWKQDELAIIANPSDDPQNWQVRHLPLAFTDTQIHLGCACWHDNNWLYVLGIKESTRQAILARISLSKLSNLELKYFEFLSAEKSNLV